MVILCLQYFPDLLPLMIQLIICKILLEKIRSDFIILQR